MNRGDVVLADFPFQDMPGSKIRPAVVVQSDAFNATHASITVCPITSDCVDAPLFRVALPPGVVPGSPRRPRTRPLAGESWPASRQLRAHPTLR